MAGAAPARCGRGRARARAPKRCHALWVSRNLNSLCVPTPIDQYVFNSMSFEILNPMSGRLRVRNALASLVRGGANFLFLPPGKLPREKGRARLGKKKKRCPPRSICVSGQVVRGSPPGDFAPRCGRSLPAPNGPAARVQEKRRGRNSTGFHFRLGLRAFPRRGGETALGRRGSINPHTKSVPQLARTPP